MLWRDKDAKWREDPLYLWHESSQKYKRHDQDLAGNVPGSIKLEKLPANAPTCGWDKLEEMSEAKVSVPGTVEEYLWAKEGRTDGNSGDYVGVSWWWRTINVPAAGDGKRYLLDFEAVNRRAEVFIDGKLVGYDVIGNTPFRLDVTPFIKRGMDQILAVRITDPGGFLGWTDNPPIVWGKEFESGGRHRGWDPFRPKLPAGIKINQSHGFGGISGGVNLLVVDAVYVEDLWMVNTPNLDRVEANLELANLTGKPVTVAVIISVAEKKTGKVVKSEKTSLGLDPGKSKTTIPLTVPGAKPWDLDHPNLYVCNVSLAAPTTDNQQPIADAASRVFGFRWFVPDFSDGKAVLRLNGKRIVLISAISWGFWPVNGLYPTPEMANKQVKMAKKIGLNMLNFHRCIGQPIVLDEADEQGLLYFQEPGGAESYQSDPVADAFNFATTQEKVVRMVRRDRSHPSLIIYNLANEPTHALKKEGDPRVAMIQAGHREDPSRVFTYASGSESHKDMKAWMKPGSQEVLWEGWLDLHAHKTVESYMDSLYKNPNDFFKKGRKDEIMIWGEDSAIGTPARFQLYHDHWSKQVEPRGWDGDDAFMNFAVLQKYLSETGLDKSFTVDSLTQACGDRQYHTLGKIVELCRIANNVGGLIVCGWENDKMTSYPGLVDILRNPKTDRLDLIKRYTEPLYVSVMLHQTIAQIGETVSANFYIVNDRDIKGSATLRLHLLDPEGQRLMEQEMPVQITGGDTTGELLCSNVTVAVPSKAGYYTVHAELVQNGQSVTLGDNRILAVDWKFAKLPSNGALLDPSGEVRQFLEGGKGLHLPDYTSSLGKLDYVIVGQEGFDVTKARRLSDQDVSLPDSEVTGLKADYFHGAEITANIEANVVMLPGVATEATKTTLKGLAFTRTDPTIDFDWSQGTPDPRLKVGEFSVRWSGKVNVTEDGWYEFSLPPADKTSVRLDNKVILKGHPDKNQRTILSLSRGLHALEMNYVHTKKTPKIALFFRPPSQQMTQELDSIMKRVAEDGTSAIFLSPGPSGGWDDSYVRYLAEKNIVTKYDGMVALNNGCYGGGYFVGDDPIFAGLPTRVAFGWEYQLFANNSIVNVWQKTRADSPVAEQNLSLKLPGVKTIVGAYRTEWGRPSPEWATALGVIPYGKGRIYLNSLEILPFLNEAVRPAHVVRKLLCNLLEDAGKKQPRSP